MLQSDFVCLQTSSWFRAVSCHFIVVNCCFNTNSEAKKTSTAAPIKKTPVKKTPNVALFKKTPNAASVKKSPKIASVKKTSDVAPVKETSTVAVAETTTLSLEERVADYLEFSMEDLEERRFKYRQLQSFAKQHKIRANQKTAALLVSLKQLFQVLQLVHVQIFYKRFGVWLLLLIDCRTLSLVGSQMAFQLVWSRRLVKNI